MNDLIKRIDNFIDKAVHVGSAAEASQYGIKLPKSAYGPTTGPKWGSSQTGASKTPKLPKAPRLTGIQGKRQRRPSIKIPKNVIAEVGRQLTPKGPYRAVGDITSDVEESGRLARKITGVGSQEG